MELHEKVSAMEAVVLSMAAENHVRDLMIKALITAHPDPEPVKALFQVQLPESAAALSNDAFELGLPEAATRQMQTAMSEAAAKWMRYFPKPASSPGTPGAR